MNVGFIYTSMVIFGLIVINHIYNLISHHNVYKNQHHRLMDMVLTEGSVSEEDPNLVRVFTTFPLNETRMSRMMDYLETLNKTLMHPRVKKVTILHDHPFIPPLPPGFPIKNPKLKIEYLNKVSRSYFTLFSYLHSNYADKLVMYIHGDNYPNEGFEKLDYYDMKSKNIFYSLTRHGANESRCNMKGFSYCDIQTNYKYHDSHDAYMFIPQPKNPLPEIARKFLDHVMDSSSIEALIAHVHRSMNYTILNPCWILRIYHIHCNPNDRRRNRQRHINFNRTVYSRNIVRMTTSLTY